MEFSAVKVAVAIVLFTGIYLDARTTFLPRKTDSQRLDAICDMASARNTILTAIAMMVAAHLHL